VSTPNDISFCPTALAGCSSVTDALLSAIPPKNYRSVSRSTCCVRLSTSACSLEVPNRLSLDHNKETKRRFIVAESDRNHFAQQSRGMCSWESPSATVSRGMCRESPSATVSRGMCSRESSSATESRGMCRESPSATVSRGMCRESPSATVSAVLLPLFHRAACPARTHRRRAGLRS